ncbi:MAG: fasciclin domain-containing protein, partial [Pseudomonadota bacterium]
IADFQLGRDKIVLDVFQVLAATPGLAEAIIENGGTAAATLTALDDNPNWTLGTDDAGDLVVTHPNGTITLAGIPGEGISSFADVAAALTVEGLGEALTGLAEASGNPATVADIVAGSGGDPDNNNDDFDLLLTALEATGLTAALADPEANFSVFAPTDAAFISLAQRLGYNGDDEAEALTTILDALTELGGGDPIPLLTDVLLYHVAPDARTLGELQLDKTVSPLFDGADLTFDGLIIEDADPDFEDAEIIAADVQAGNAVVQVINEVLLPLDL